MIMRSLLAVICLALAALCITPSRADFDSSRAWFLSLDDVVRSGIQGDLLLTGQYESLVDGDFGVSTFAALQAFQSQRGEPPSGVLSAAQLGELRAEAANSYSQLGFQKTDDSSTGLEIYVPTNVLTSRLSAADGATLYRSADGHFVLRLFKAEGSSESELSVKFKENTNTSANKTIYYSTENSTSYVVSGISFGSYFYERAYLTGSDIVGFRLTWDPSVRARGSLLATYLASFSRPIATSAAQTSSGSESTPTTVPPRAAPAPDLNSSETTEVPLQPLGGTFVVPVRINGALTLDFTLDSGAAIVSVPADVVMTLIRTGTITNADFTGTESYVMADGRTVPSQKFKIRSLTVGNVTVRDVDASVAPVEGGLLLGQTFLSHFASWSMDNSRHVLVLRGGDSKGMAMVGEPSIAIALPQALPAPTASSTSAVSGTRLALYGGMDFYGNDIFKGRVADAVQCASSCLENRLCQAFTFNANPSIHSGPNCFLKDSVGRVEAYSTAIGGLILQEGQLARSYDFDAIDPTTDLLPNQDLRGDNLSSYPYGAAQSVDGCRMACVDNSQCMAFSFVAVTKQCWLKGASATPRRMNGVISGRKRHVSIEAADVLNVPR